MAKKIYIQAKKDIEALLQENGDSEICAGISEYSSVWEEAFIKERIYLFLRTKHWIKTYLRVSAFGLPLAS